MLLTFGYVFIIAFLLSCFCTPYVLVVVERLGVVDIPDSRKVHERVIPLMGGISIYLSFAIASGAAFLLHRGRLLGEYDTNYMGMVLGSLLILILGIYDDIKGAKAGLKLTVQVIASLVLIGSGYGIERMTNPFGGEVIVGVWGTILTVIWIVGITNAMNLIDGLDGLAAGIGAIAALTLFFASFQNPPFVSVLSVALLGSTLGFLRYNFYPARIFLGDTGSMFLGFILAAISIQGSFKGTAAVALIIPLLALAIPILDTTTVFVRRILTKKHPFQADTKHFHHRLIALGYTHKQTVLIFYQISLVLGAIALILRYAGRELVMPLLLLIGLMSFIFLKMVEDLRTNNNKR